MINKRNTNLELWHLTTNFKRLQEKKLNVRLQEETGLTIDNISNIAGRSGKNLSKAIEMIIQNKDGINELKEKLNFTASNISNILGRSGIYFETDLNTLLKNQKIIKS